jgi:bifunctional UDP-N-acetylglucosamine pyrophosphorylase/glucosamine-1-phosphate N-acetyltransferase
MKTTPVILAAGQGTRMRSSLPKVLHPLAGLPLVQYSLRAVAAAGLEKPVVVIGHDAEKVRQAVGDQASFALQEQQLGTGHAVRMAEPLLRDGTDYVLVISADMPLFRPQTLAQLVEIGQSNPGPVTLLTVVQDDSHGFGRIVRNPEGKVQAIVEEAGATPQQLAIREVNVGAYCFRADWLWDALARIPLSPKGEYYLTDTVGLALAEGLNVGAIVLTDAEEAIGINTRVHLAEAETILRRRILTDHMLNGVTIVDPLSTYIEVDVQIGQDTVIYPNTHLRGKTVIGEDSRIGPNTIIESSRIGDLCTILAAVIEQSVVEDEVHMGPFAHLRPGAHLGQGVHMGNFGEVKSSYLAPGVKMGHFSYIGDATIGEETNIGAGTITCNFDGKRKHKTEIGANVFIGSDTMLVAPLKIGDGARTGAGSVVTRDVEPNTLVVGVPARFLKKWEPRD